MPNVRMRSRACLMYDLIKIGQPHERDADTGDVSLCDIGTDGAGFFITYGSREDIEKMAPLPDGTRHPWEYRAVPLPWQPEQPS
jgi:hypothetical protein